MLTDNIIEQKGIFLRNLNNNSANTTLDEWYQGNVGAYGFYTITYETPLKPNHYYYQRYTYKFTTTNQSPTWVDMYLQDGYTSGARKNNPAVNTEYTVSGVQQLITVNRPTTEVYSLTYANIYNGPSNAISGVTAYVKNVLVYDVTELYMILRQCNVATDTLTTLTTWCDTNLRWQPRQTNYNITSLLPSTTTNKIAIKGGDIVAKNFIEPDGMQYYSYSTTLSNNTYFDTGSGVSVYNNSGGGTVTHSRINADNTSPFFPKHKYILQIKTNGTASPGTGGFVATHQAGADKIFIETFVAKIPTGYTVTAAYNPQGTGASVTYLTSRAGTGNWEEYKILYRCGSSGTFSNGGHVYLTGSNLTSVTWYLAYVNNCDITSNQHLMYYTVLPQKTVYKNGNIFANEFNTTQLFTNRNFLSQPDLGGGWVYDTTDYAGDANFSIVQPVNCNRNALNIKWSIVPGLRYKVSYWVKCKADMTSFLTAIDYYTDSGVAVHHGEHVFVPGTKTTLSKALNPGDTEVYLTSVANWVVKNYSFLGFRSGLYTSSYNDKGSSQGGGSTGLIQSVDATNKKIVLRSAYSGTAQASGTVIVESFDGGNYPYPIQKAQLPTDNTWKYVEGYFGVANDSANGANGGWAGIPAACTYMKIYLNLYQNTGTVPIKFSDIRVEAVDGGDCNRNFNKIQIPGGQI